MPQSCEVLREACALRAAASGRFGRGSAAIALHRSLHALLYPRTGSFCRTSTFGSEKRALVGPTVLL